jgi:integrase
MDPTPPPSPTLSALRDRWLTHVASTRKPATVLQYRKRTNLMLRRLGTLPVAQLTADQITTHLAAVNAGRAPDTVRANIVAWEQFQRWAIADKHLTAPLTAPMRKPQGRERQVLPTEQQVDAIMAACPPDFRLLYRALRVSGARPMELVNATIEMIDRAQQVIVVGDHKTAGKTGKPRLIAIGHTLDQILREAIGTRIKGRIFLTSSRMPWTVERASRIFRGLRDRLQCPRELCLYLTRHEHGTQIYAKTGDLKAVADALGHTQLATSNRYAKSSPETLAKKQDLFEE